MSISFSNTNVSPHLLSLGSEYADKNSANTSGMILGSKTYLILAIVDGLEIPEFVISTRSGKILQLHKNAATGSAVAVAGIVSRTIENEKIGTPQVKEDYSFDSMGSAHDGTVSRSDSADQGGGVVSLDIF